MSHPVREILARTVLMNECPGAVYQTHHSCLHRRPRYAHVTYKTIMVCVPRVYAKSCERRRVNRSDAAVYQHLPPIPANSQKLQRTTSSVAVSSVQLLSS
ncbi:hypothetical protein MRX96_052563 [Rhipicephalus microplus]